MTPKSSRTALSALLGLGILAGGLLAASSAAIAQGYEGEYGDPPDLLTPYRYQVLPDQRLLQQQRPRWHGPASPGPAWHGPAWRGPAWHGPGWSGPGVGIYVEPPRPRYRPRYYARPAAEPHVEWCYDRYRSYREWDNTWQPLRGPRRECVSPYY